MSFVGEDGVSFGEEKADMIKVKTESSDSDLDDDDPGVKTCKFMDQTPQEEQDQDGVPNPWLQVTSGEPAPRGNGVQPDIAAEVATDISAQGTQQIMTEEPSEEFRGNEVNESMMNSLEERGAYLARSMTNKDVRGGDLVPEAMPESRGLSGPQVTVRQALEPDELDLASSNNNRLRARVASPR